jgi:hypothetical protein
MNNQEHITVKLTPTFLANCETFTISQDIIDKVDIEIYGSLENAKKEKAKEEKLWCKCEGEHDSYYVPDNQDRRCSKHHYRCNHCKKITQIG